MSPMYAMSSPIADFFREGGRGAERGVRAVYERCCDDDDESDGRAIALRGLPVVAYVPVG